jgi:hypothetical protein
VGTSGEPNKKRIVATASAVLDDGTIVEMTFHPDLRRTLFAIYNAGRWTLQDAIGLGPDAKLRGALSLASVFLVFTGTSIARTFFITAAMFGATSLYGYPLAYPYW